MNAKTVIAFLAGAAVGSFVTWKYMKKNELVYTYEEEFTEEENEPEEPVEEKQASFRFEKPDLLEYAAKIREARYAVDTHIENEEEKGGDEPVDHSKPYVISPEEFGEEDDYATESLFYYVNGVLTNTQNEVIENVDELIGEESLNHFGEYEDDSVFVRNDDIRTDFEILFDRSDFDDSKSNSPADED